MNNMHETFFTLLKQATNAGCPNSGEHFNKISPAYVKSGIFASPAIAFANKVFPVPGAPNIKHPLRMRPRMSKMFLDFSKNL
jgi:hypothetical protein